MKTTIWKFPIGDTQNQLLLLPEDAELLCIKDIAETFMLYVLMDPDKKPVRRIIHCIGSGETISRSNLRYIETLVRREGHLVFHFFEERQP
jgi:hypothetical protein